MGSVIQTGYSLPGGNQPLTHARILHERNRARVRAVSTTAETTGFEASAVDNGLTYDAWQPFSNQAADPLDLNETAWTATRLTVGADGQTIDEGTDVSTTRNISQTFTYTAVEWVAAVKVERQSMDSFILQGNDGTTSYTAIFDIHAGTCTPGAGVTCDLVDLGEDIFECRMYFTPAAGTGFLRIFPTLDGATTYTGTNRTMRVLRTVAHVSEAVLRLDLFKAETVDTSAIAGHNLGTGAGEITFQHDSDENDVWTSLETIEPTDDSPIMLTHAEVTSVRWRIRVRRGVLPRIAVYRVGAALQLERPLYGGHTPLDLGRQTILKSNYSETGEFLGRTKHRTYFATEFQWENLTAAWVRTNWTVLQRAIETEPFFMAWRPLSFNEAGYCQTDQVPAPSNQGVRDLMSVALSVRSLGYD